MTVVSTEDPGPLGPWVVACTASWWLGQQLEVRDGLRTVTHRCTDAVVSGVTTSDDDDVLALCTNVAVVL